MVSKDNTAKDIKTGVSTALQPYKAPPVPAIIGPLGDLQAFLKAAENAPILTPEQERSLAVALREQGDLNAAQLLILSHLRLVISIARGFLGYGLSYADLIQEGNIGLMKAIRHYDPDRGTRLMTFATHWIKAEIQEYIIKNWRIVKLATTKNQRKLFFNLRQMKEDYQKALTYQEADHIASELDVKPKDVLEMEERLFGQETSLDAPAVDNGDEEADFTPLDWLSDENSEPVKMLENKAHERLESEGLQSALQQLDERSRRVIEARFLHIDENGQNKAVTLQELAYELGVSAERVRQIERQAIGKLHELLAPQAENLDL